MGTADYLSPEQIRSPRDITPASDIYSLGCTLYYAVTGKVPFPGGTTRDKARRHLEETPWHPRRFNPDISEEFVEIIADMMEKDPESRDADGGRSLPAVGAVGQRLRGLALAADDQESLDATTSAQRPGRIGRSGNERNRLQRR